MGEGLRGRGRYVWPKARHRCAQSRVERLLGGSVLGHGGGGADTTRAVMAEVAAARQKFYQQGGFMQGADVMTWADSVPGQERHDGAEDAAQLLYERNRHDALTLAGVRAGQLRREEQAAGKSVAAVDGELAATGRAINQGHGRSDVGANLAIRGLLDQNRETGRCRRCGRFVSGPDAPTCGHCRGPHCPVCPPPDPVSVNPDVRGLGYVDGVEYQPLRVGRFGIRLVPLSDPLAGQLLGGNEQDPPAAALRNHVQQHGRGRYTSFVIGVGLDNGQRLVDLDTKDPGQAVFHYTTRWTRRIKDGQVEGDDFCNDEIQAAYEVAKSAARQCPSCGRWYNQQIGCQRDHNAEPATRPASSVNLTPAQARVAAVVGSGGGDQGVADAAAVGRLKVELRRFEARPARERTPGDEEVGRGLEAEIKRLQAGMYEPGGSATVQVTRPHDWSGQGSTWVEHISGELRREDRSWMADDFVPGLEVRDLLPGRLWRPEVEVISYTPPPPAVPAAPPPPPNPDTQEYERETAKAMLGNHAAGIIELTPAERKAYEEAASGDPHPPAPPAFDPRQRMETERELLLAETHQRADDDSYSRARRTIVKERVQRLSAALEPVVSAPTSSENEVAARTAGWADYQQAVAAWQQGETARLLLRLDRAKVFMLTPEEQQAAQALAERVAGVRGDLLHALDPRLKQAERETQARIAAPRGEGRPSPLGYDASSGLGAMMRRSTEMSFANPDPAAREVLVSEYRPEADLVRLLNDPAPGVRGAAVVENIRRQALYEAAPVVAYWDRTPPPEPAGPPPHTGRVELILGEPSRALVGDYVISQYRTKKVAAQSYGGLASYRVVGEPRGNYAVCHQGAGQVLTYFDTEQAATTWLLEAGDHPAWQRSVNDLRRTEVGRHLMALPFDLNLVKPWQRVRCHVCQRQGLPGEACRYCVWDDELC